MRTAISRLAALTAVLALVPAASALAAPPDKQATLNSATPSYSWSATGTGAVVTSTVGNKVGCNPVLFTCDFVLLKTEVPGDLTRDHRLGRQDAASTSTCTSTRAMPTARRASCGASRPEARRRKRSR